MAKPGPQPSKAEALAIVRDDREAILALVERLPSRALSLAGLGGGDWSPADLIGHLESWEQHALEAMAAWERGERAAIDRDLEDGGVDAVNARDIERKKDTAPPDAFTRAAATHAALIDAIEPLSDARWAEPVRSGGARSLGERVGGILGGPEGPFTHDRAHLPELAEFADEHGA
jgi:Mycothiol maleylpyruvate isomerase N-terminal domain